MSRTSCARGGGTFCRFTIGSGEKGASARHLRYIASPQAVKEGREGVWLKEFPEILEKVSYPVLVESLLQYAHWCEQEEFIIGQKAKLNQNTRTHYTAILSFETPVSTAGAKEMLSAWMSEAFPRAQAAAFLHRNTRHLHLHVWIAARQTDGKKINLSARAFRQLDETWNRLYSRAIDRDEREHLLKKGETERWKQLSRERTAEGKALRVEKPERVGHHWNPLEFNDRERERLGGGDREETGKIKAEEHDVNETGVGGDQRGATTGIGRGEDQSRGTEARDPSVAEALRQEQKTVGEAQRAVSALVRLYREVERMGELTQKPTRETNLSREIDFEREG